MKTGIELISQERKEQIEKHGMTIKYDCEANSDGDLRRGAIALLGYQGKSDILLMPGQWNLKIIQKMCCKGYKERLIIAGALIAAEIDRLQGEMEPGFEDLEGKK